MISFTTFFAFLLGVFLAPAIRPLFRPVLVEMIRAGLVVGDEVRRTSHTVREGVEDVQAEARTAKAARETTESAPPSQPAAPRSSEPVSPPPSDAADAPSNESPTS